MPKFYIYRAADFDPSLLVSVPCMDEHARAESNYVYPWARTEIYPGVFCAWAKGGNVHYQGSGADKLREHFKADTISGVYDAPLPEPTESPKHTFELDIDVNALMGQWLDGICLMAGTSEIELAKISNEAKMKIVRVSRAQFIPFKDFVAQESSEADFKQPVKAGDPAQFNNWVNRMNVALQSTCGFPSQR